MELVLEEGAKYKIRSWRSMANEFDVFDGDCINAFCGFSLEMKHLCGHYTTPALSVVFLSRVPYIRVYDSGDMAGILWNISLDMIDWTAEVLY